MEHHLYYLILGSNLGDRELQLARAKELIVLKAGDIQRISTLYETQPWGHEEQPWFINQVVGVSSPLEPIELLYTIKNIEKETGRQPSERWHERHIDIDILLADTKIIDQEDLVIPHPLIPLRNFVLIPLMEVACNAVHPVLHQTIEELYMECRDTGEVYIFNQDEQGKSV
ncbi:MAG: 2-amino-4-hydroxy-6-hydroxymethyldihydropteridine diphosphokinase [Bacteroidota bacterium]|nr:2-amino-4-hydroxy-6-hydroxymethyldihydropteridine diphosphokinase [Bacteroidota bacterium]